MGNFYGYQRKVEGRKGKKEKGRKRKERSSTPFGGMN